MIRKLLIATVIIAAALCASSCARVADNGSADTGAATERAAYNLSGYTVVRGDSAGEFTIKTASALNTLLGRLTGSETAIATDWEKAPDEKAIAARREILIGETNRPESAAAYALLAGDDYIIRADGNKIVIAASTDELLGEAVNAFIGQYLGYKSSGASSGAEKEQNMTDAHNVKAFGARGDGVTDDTAAFLAAVAAAEFDGLPVFVPGGTYVLTDTVTLNSVTLYGYPMGAWTADSCDLPTIVHKDMTKPLFDVRSGSLSGLFISCEYTAGVSKSDTVRITGTGGRVTDMTIRNPYIAIMCDDASNPGRCYIGNIFIVQAYSMGVYVAGTYDVPIIENVEVWNPGDTCPVAFRLAHNDDIRAVNLFAFNATIGFLINESKTGSFWGSLSNCSVDYTSIGMKIEGKGHHIAVTGGCWWVHHRAISVEPKTEGTITVSGCEFKSNGDSALCIAGGTMVTVTGCNINRTFDGGDVPAVKISGGDMVNINGCTIYSRNDGFVLSSRGNICSISGNIINCGGKAIRDTSKDCTKNDYESQNAIKTGLVLD